MTNWEMRPQHLIGLRATPAPSSPGSLSDVYRNAVESPWDGFPPMCNSNGTRLHVPPATDPGDTAAKRGSVQCRRCQNFSVVGFPGVSLDGAWFLIGRGITSEGRPRTIVFPVPASTDWRRRSCIRTGFPSSNLAAFARFRNAAVSPRAFSRIAWPSFCALTTCAKIYFRSPGNMISLTSTTVRVNPRPLVFGSVFSNRALPISCRMVMTSSIFSPPTSSRRASCRIM